MAIVYQKCFNFEKHTGKLQNKCSSVSHPTLLRYFESLTSFFLQSYSHTTYYYFSTVVYYYFSKRRGKYNSISGWCEKCAQLCVLCVFVCINIIKLRMALHEIEFGSCSFWCCFVHSGCFVRLLYFSLHGRRLEIGMFLALRQSVHSLPSTVHVCFASAFFFGTCNTRK